MATFQTGRDELIPDQPGRSKEVKIIRGDCKVM
jgi:hypothetical protein